MLAVISCTKGEPVESMSGFHREEGTLDVIPDGGSKVISFVVDDDIVFGTKSGISSMTEALEPETFTTTGDERLKYGGAVSVSMEKSFLPGYGSPVEGMETKGSTYVNFDSQVTDLNSFHVYAYTPGTNLGNSLVYAWDEDFTKGADGVFRSATNREWPDTDPEWSFIATNCPSVHLTKMTIASSSNSSSAFQYKYTPGSTPYNPVPDAMFAFNYNNKRAEWSYRSTIENNGTTGYTLSSYESRNTLSFKHMYARIGNVTVVNQTGQNVSKVKITFAGTMVTNCYGFGVGTYSYYNITQGMWSARSDDKVWITSFGPSGAGTVEEGLYLMAPASSLLFNVSWEADEPGNGHQVYTDIPVTVSGFQPGMNYNLTFTLGMGGQPVPQTSYFKLYVVSAGPGANDCLVFGSQTTALNISYFPTLYYSLDNGVMWKTFDLSRMCTDGKCYFHTDPVHQGDYILLKGNLESNISVNPNFGDRYFMFADYQALTENDNSVRSLQPSSIAAAYAMGEMKSLAEGRISEAGGQSYKAGDFTDIFNANLPLSVGSVLYSHPFAHDYYNDPEYNIIAPWADDITAADRNEFHHDLWNMTRCFKGSHLSYLPFSGDSGKGVIDVFVYTRCIWTECFGSCADLVDDAVLDLHQAYYGSLEEFRRHANKNQDYNLLASGSPLDDFFNDY